ncbi:histidine kinase [Alicyclobacillus curvatus]|nr:histidine kinase [Alicyclobacillus curvatus]
MSSNTGEVFGTNPGQLKIFIGAAPGVGKTYTMLREAVSLKERGIDVVIGYVDVRDRPETRAQMDGLEVLPRKIIHFHHRVFEEVDIEAITERGPDVVVIDELAHSNAPGSMFPKRYMDVEYLLDMGISVLTTVNVQHIEGIHDEAEEITGIPVRELIPESLIKRADEVSVIDVTPETLRQRLRDGSIYPADRVDQALQNFFRKSNLSGLRELALRVVAEDVDERLERSYSRRRIPGPVGAKEVIMVCVSHYPRAVKLIGRGDRMAARMKADMYVLFIAGGGEDSLSEKERANLVKLKTLADECEGEFIIEPRNDRKTGEVIADVASRYNVTQIVIGQPAPDRKWELWRENPVRYLLRNLRYTDLRIVGWRDPPDTMLKLPKSSEVQSDGSQSPRLRGRLTIYVGAAPGVGKTYKMLQDARDWRKRGWDVVIGLIETHGRAETAAQIGDLEVISKREILLEGGRTYDEMDVDAIVRRKPSIVLVDELAHTNVPGCRREKRYQDIQYLLEQGINVVTAVNVQHLESLHDKVEHITGIKVRERIPDWFMKLAREIKLIDVTPETLQQRLVEGRIYARDKIERALDNFFQTANLAALRELALLEVADDVDQRIDRARKSRKWSQDTERILVCVNHRPHSEKLIRRGWRIADRLQAELWVLVVSSEEVMNPEDERDFAKIKHLSEQFDAHFLSRPAVNHNIGLTIVQTAMELEVSQLVAGQPLAQRGVFSRFRPNPLDYVLEHAEFVDLHIVAYERD